MSLEIIILIGLSAATLIISCLMGLRYSPLQQNCTRLETQILNQNQCFEKLTQRFEENHRTNENFLRTFTEELRNNHSQIRETLLRSLNEIQQALLENLNKNRFQQQQGLSEFKEQLLAELNQYRQNFDKHQLSSLKILQESLQQGMSDVRHQITNTLNYNTETLSKRVEKLTQDTDQRLKEISGQVEKRLTEGFEKTTATFTDVIKRLALIDEAQKKITELSSNVISLQEVLSDKRSRGAFGEVQLTALIRNVIPENHFEFQYTFKDGKRADCILFLPEPTGNVVIDAKFPLENYRRSMDIELPETERRAAEQQFRQDVRRHIQDIAEKYIIPGETSDGAVMFIPAEAIFAEIHARYPDLVEIAHKSRVWLVSPTTMMAILTTARAVLKDAATRKQIHIIQEHLSLLAKDFERFQKRMTNLAKHIEQAHGDVKEVQTSADKITSRFTKIEKVEIESLEETKIELISADG